MTLIWGSAGCLYRQNFIITSTNLVVSSEAANNVTVRLKANCQQGNNLRYEVMERKFHQSSMVPAVLLLEDIASRQVSEVDFDPYNVEIC